MDMASNPAGIRTEPTLARTGRLVRTAALAAVLGCGLTVSGCITESHTHGYVVTQDQLSQVPVGSSQEQVLLVLGTPTTTATISGEAFYYISQQTRRTLFLDPKVVDQRVLAIYFDRNRRVTNIGNYGLKDGKVFDFLNRRTRTGGSDYGFLAQLLRGVGRVNL